MAEGTALLDEAMAGALGGEARELSTVVFAGATRASLLVALGERTGCQLVLARGWRALGREASPPRRDRQEIMVGTRGQAAPAPRTAGHGCSRPVPVS